VKTTGTLERPLAGLTNRSYAHSDARSYACGFDRKATAISLLVVLGVRADGQKVCSRSDMAEKRRGLAQRLDDLTRRGLRRPEFLIVDGAAGLDSAIAAAWDGVPSNDAPCTSTGTFCARARAHADEITADYKT